MSASMAAVASRLIAALIAAFGAAFVLALIITQRGAYALRQIGQAAQRIAAEQYDTRIDLSGETNAEIVRLSAAFNRMAETLKSALRAESAAQAQNHAQLMKLAQQERKTAVLEERQRIARELHDSVKQQLFSMTLAAGAAVNLLDHSPGHVRTYLEHIQQAGHTTQSEMTTLLQELVPVSMQEKRLEDALLAYLTPLCEIHGLKLLWRVDGTNTLTIAQEHALFRAVQEAVANVVRHSGATVLHVSFYFGLVTQVIVEDNGVGFVPDAVPATSAGLALMRTRLMRAGGRYELQTAPGLGTRLTMLMDLRRRPHPLAPSPLRREGEQGFAVYPLEV
jgi:NarL family two-component system sensor histidine kinase LiaS